MTSMKITILGSGTCVPRLDRSACAALVETDKAKILLDLGPGTIHRLLEYGVTIFDLTHVLLTHFHPDHTGELASLLFATKYPDQHKRKSRLTITAGPGLQAFYQGLRAGYGDWIVLPESQMVIRQIDAPAGETIQFADLCVTARPVNHRPESLAYRFETGDGVAMVSSGDTDECDTLVKLAEAADLLICESAMPDGQKVPGHLTPSLAGKIASRAGVKQLVLTHLYPPCDQVDIVKQARTTYKGPVIAAEDLMTFRL